MHEIQHLAQSGEEKAAAAFPDQRRLGEMRELRLRDIPESAIITRGVENIFSTFWEEFHAYNAVGPAPISIGDATLKSMALKIYRFSSDNPTQAAAVGLAKLVTGLKTEPEKRFEHLLCWISEWTNLSPADRLARCGESQVAI